MFRLHVTSRTILSFGPCLFGCEFLSTNTQVLGCRHSESRELDSFIFLILFFFKWCLHLLSEKAMAPHSNTLAWKIPWTEKPGGCSPWGCWGSDTTEGLRFHFSLSYIGEGNGNPIQCSCLENPRDGGACWAAVLGSHRVEHDWSDLAATY